MRENLMSGSRWQGMETRHGEGTEALSQETESNGSVPPKSQAPSPDPTSGFLGVCGFEKHFSGFEFFLLSNRISARPKSANASRWP